MESWLQDLTTRAPDACCIAVAAPPSDDLVRMSNINWAFSCRDLADRFGFDRVNWLNDFQANAYSLPYLQDADRTVLHQGKARAGGKLAVMGPGTGLGGATLEQVKGQRIATTCEPGHMGLAPGTTEELKLFAQLLPRYGELHAERLVSGPGLLLLYQSLAESSGQAALARTPDQISRAALRDQDGAAGRRWECFVHFSDRPVVISSSPTGPMADCTWQGEFCRRCWTSCARAHSTSASATRVLCITTCRRCLCTL